MLFISLLALFVAHTLRCSRHFQKLLLDFYRNKKITPPRLIVNINSPLTAAQRNI